MDAMDQALERGSYARGGRSCVAIGDGTGFYALAAGAEATFTFQIEEACVMDRLSIISDASHQLVVTQFKADGDSLVGGQPSAACFAPDNPHNPFLGHGVVGSSTVVVKVKNVDGSAAADVACGISTR